MIRFSVADEITKSSQCVSMKPPGLCAELYASPLPKQDHTTCVPSFNISFPREPPNGRRLRSTLPGVPAGARDEVTSF